MRVDYVNKSRLSGRRRFVLRRRSQVADDLLQLVLVLLEPVLAVASAFAGVGCCCSMNCRAWKTSERIVCMRLTKVSSSFVLEAAASSVPSPACSPAIKEHWI